MAEVGDARVAGRGVDGVSRPAIVFIGFMAAGKSAAARAAAATLGTTAEDADELIERRLGEPIAAFFEREGEAEFRRREEELVLELLRSARNDPAPVVLALGGGAVESERVREALAGHLCVWCRVDEELAWERASRDDERPLAADRDGFARRFARARSPPTSPWRARSCRAAPARPPRAQRRGSPRCARRRACG